MNMDCKILILLDISERAKDFSVSLSISELITLFVCKASVALHLLIFRFECIKSG